MNTLVCTKMMANGHRRVIRQSCCFKPWFNAYSVSSKLPILYVGARKTRRNSLIKKSIVSELYPVSGTHIEARTFYLPPPWRGQESSSKVEDTVKSIKETKNEKEKESRNAAWKEVAPPSEKKVAQTRTLWQKCKAEILHYYHGFRLLGLDMKVSAKLIWRILHGKELSRREHRLLVKTTGDMFRLIPFSVFIIVPFMELLLPVVIKLFPGLLPSTFQTATEKEDKLKQALKVKIEMAKFLQQTLDDMALQSSDHKSEKAKEFAEFFYKVRTGDAVASNEEIMKFSKLFEDEITLDSLSRPQLVALCRVLDVQTLGTTNFLRFLLRMKLRSLAADDKLIEKEGVESLTRSELQQACRARAMRAYGLPENRLREQLSQWLDLSLIKKVPPSLLLLSRALMVPDTIPMSDKLKATISALPDTVVARTQGAIGEKEGKLDHKTNIEIIKMEEKKIEEERREQGDDKPEPTTVYRESKKDEITTTDVKVIEQALDSLGKEKNKMALEKEELKELKEEMAEYQEDIEELDEIKAQAKGQKDIESIKVSKGAKRLFNKVNKMIQKMDAVLLELERSEKQVKEKIESLAPEEKTDAKEVEELVKIDELIGAIKQIQSVPDESRLKRIAEILGKIDDDRDGAIKIEDVLKVVELIGKEDVKLSKKQVDELIDLMDKEEILEVEEQIQKALQKVQNEESKKTPGQSSVPATPVTTEAAYGSEELKDEAKVLDTAYKTEEMKDPADVNTKADESAKKGNSTDARGPASDQAPIKSAAVLESGSNRESASNPTLTPSVPPTTKTTEGSKHL